MMTNGPAATVGEILDIELPRPRNRIELADNSQYNHYRHDVLKFLYEKQRKVESVDEHRKSSSDSHSIGNKESPKTESDAA
jgi:nitrate/nitrite transport system ATP-binding protein